MSFIAFCMSHRVSAISADHYNVGHLSVSRRTSAPCLDIIVVHTGAKCSVKFAEGAQKNHFKQTA
jgi:hypothetical protein